MELLSFFCVLQNRNSHISTKRAQFLISLNRSCSNLSRVKEVVGAVVANFPGELGRLAAMSNLRLLEQQLRAHQDECTTFFSFKSICSVLSSVKEAVGANVACVSGELGRLGSWSNSCLLEPQLRAHQKKSSGLFSFKRIYSILSCVKQDVAADDANFLGEFTGKLPGPTFIG